MRDGVLIAFLAGAIVVGIGLLAGCGVVVQWAWEANISCPAFGSAVERPTRYRFFAGGCFVQDRDGRWVSTDNYHSTSITN